MFGDPRVPDELAPIPRAVGPDDPRLVEGQRRRRQRQQQSKKIEENREDHFDVQAGRFRDPSTGRFEIGGSPPDYDPRTNRFRDERGRFKSRSQDLYDEPQEVQHESLIPWG